MRLICTRCCCPMESLWIENRRNAISIENRSCFFNEALWSWLGFSRERWTGFKNPRRPLSLRKRGDSQAYSQSLVERSELTRATLGSDVGRGNRNCFFTRFVVKRHAYVAKRISAFCGHPRKLERVGRDFSIARGVFRSPERPESESASRGRRDVARASACES